jgi:membrane dipeptidase
MNNERMPMADFHQDTINPQLAEILENPELSHAAERANQLPKEGLKKVDLIFASVYRRMSEIEKAASLAGDQETIDQLRRDEEMILDYYQASKDFKIITRPEDLEERQSENSNNVILHKEGGDIITGPEVVDELYERGIRSVGILYNHDNQLGGGASGNKSRGLTALGKRVVDRMVEKGMIIDIAHANRKTADDILDRVGDYKQSVATHTTFGTEERFITRELLRKIADKGGVVGFTPIRPFFPDLEKFIENFKRASDISGSVDNLAIGTDFGGVNSADLFSELDEIGKLAVVAEKLSESGDFTDEEIHKIMYGNIERIVKKLK